MGAIPTSDAKQLSVSTRPAKSPRTRYQSSPDLSKEELLYGIAMLVSAHGAFTRIARELDLTRASVRRVAMGKATSARVEAGLAREISRIKRRAEVIAEISSKVRPETQGSISHLLPYRGIQDRIASALQVSQSQVSRVIAGKRKNPAILSAYAAEMARLDRERHAQHKLEPVLSGDGARDLETRPRETTAQPATASPDTASCGANGENSSPAPERRADSPSSLLRTDVVALPKYVPLIEAAKSLGVGRDTVVRLIKDGRLRGYRTSANGWWRVTPESLGEYMGKLRTDVPALHTFQKSSIAPMQRKRRNAVPEQFPRTTQTASQVARRLQTSPQTVGRLIQDGKLKGYKLREGGQWHILTSSLESLEAELIGPHAHSEAAS